MEHIVELIDSHTYASEPAEIARLKELAALDANGRARIVAQAADLVRDIRSTGNLGLMEVFLAEYGLSTDEGIALMCLAEALLRVPDAHTIDALIEDKIAPSDWGKHLGQSNSSLVNASTWALMLTGRVLEDAEPGIAGTLRGAVKRLGEPVIRRAVSRAMREMGRQFVLGESIKSAMKRAADMEKDGFTYSYDMLGEAARTEEQAKTYLEAYSRAIKAIAKAANHKQVAENPGISVKLSALHPRYEEAHREQVIAEMVPNLLRLAQEARAAQIGFNIDAEEADRLQLSLDIIERTLEDPSLASWDGFGIVIQAYGKRASHVIDWVYATAERLDRKLMVRLVKGAYWDAEIKRTQVMGLADFPVFTNKSATDISYIANARKLLSLSDRIYPQFATHNAHTVCAILQLAQDLNCTPSQYEFQRLHGMGEVMHRLVMEQNGTRCRIYAPVGAHRDLLAYLVRRLLENGANSSFVNQIVDEELSPEDVVSCPWDKLDAQSGRPALPTGSTLFDPERKNSHGFDLTQRSTLAALEADRAPWAAHQWNAQPLVAFADATTGATVPAVSPTTGETIGQVALASAADANTAFEAAKTWDAPVSVRAACLRKAADLYEAHTGELFALLAREAGKTLLDAEGELREAVDFLRYYAHQAESAAPHHGRGTWVAISPWNFPLAIFSGQIAAALATGNAVLAKPSEETPLVAYRAVELLHEAGVPVSALQFLPGAGDLGAALTSHKDVAGTAFTGSTATAHKIRSTMAKNAKAGTPLIAETGGLNAMIVDSTALPEHAVRDIIASAFQSAGQRCSALRCLYVQDDIADDLIAMLKGAMNTLHVNNPWAVSTDIGPLINQTAFDTIQGHIDTADRENRLLHQLDAPKMGHFIGPAMIAIDSIADLDREIFGPVLHVARFKAEQLDQVIDDINGRGFGLTFGMHTRIDDRVQYVVDRIKCGNIYINRNQIGAVVGSQPFGGEGLSGTGPKAGGPRYIKRFMAPTCAPQHDDWENEADLDAIKQQLSNFHDSPLSNPVELPGPTGESNRLWTKPKGVALCLGPSRDAMDAQIAAIEALGGKAIGVAGEIPSGAINTLPHICGVMWWGDAKYAQALEHALAQRSGAIIPLITTQPDAGHALAERHVCVDTTAAGGNAQLLAEQP